MKENLNHRIEYLHRVGELSSFALMTGLFGNTMTCVGTRDGGKNEIFRLNTCVGWKNCLVCSVMQCVAVCCSVLQ